MVGDYLMRSMPMADVLRPAMCCRLCYGPCRFGFAEDAGLPWAERPGMANLICRSDSQASNRYNTMEEPTNERPIFGT